jgi:hypothetical protein
MAPLHDMIVYEPDDVNGRYCLPAASTLKGLHHLSLNSGTSGIGCQQPHVQSAVASVGSEFPARGRAETATLVISSCYVADLPSSGMSATFPKAGCIKGPRASL